MSNDKSYNGYANYETWNAALWIDNDEGLQTSVLEQASELIGRKDMSSDQERSDVRYELADWIENLIDELKPELDASMFSDMLNASLREVDYRELAEGYIDQVLENRRYTEGEAA